MDKVDYGKQFLSNDVQVMNKILETLKEEDPRLLFAYLLKCEGSLSNAQIVDLQYDDLFHIDLKEPFKTLLIVHARNLNISNYLFVHKSFNRGLAKDTIGAFFTKAKKIVSKLVQENNEGSSMETTENTQQEIPLDTQKSVKIRVNTEPFIINDLSPGLFYLDYLYVRNRLLEKSEINKYIWYVLTEVEDGVDKVYALLAHRMSLEVFGQLLNDTDLKKSYTKFIQNTREVHIHTDILKDAVQELRYKRCKHVFDYNVLDLIKAWHDHLTQVEDFKSKYNESLDIIKNQHNKLFEAQDKVKKMQRKFQVARAKSRKILNEAIRKSNQLSRQLEKEKQANKYVDNNTFVKYNKALTRDQFNEIHEDILACNKLYKYIWYALMESECSYNAITFYYNENFKKYLSPELLEEFNSISKLNKNLNVREDFEKICAKYGLHLRIEQSYLSYLREANKYFNSNITPMSLKEYSEQQEQIIIGLNQRIRELEKEVRYLQEKNKQSCNDNELLQTQIDLLKTKPKKNFFAKLFGKV